MAGQKSSKINPQTAKQIKALYHKKKAEHEALKAEHDQLLSECSALKDQCEVLRRELGALQTDYREAKRTIDHLESQLAAANLLKRQMEQYGERLQNELLFLRETESQPEIAKLSTAEGRAYQAFLVLDPLERGESIKVATLLEKMMVPLSDEEREQFFPLMRRFLRYYCEVNDIEMQIGTRHDLIMKWYRLVRLDEQPRPIAPMMAKVGESLVRRQEGRIGKATEVEQPAEGAELAELAEPSEQSEPVAESSEPSESATESLESVAHEPVAELLPPVDARSDDAVLGANPVVKRKERLQRQLRSVFDPMLEPAERDQFYADMTKLFEICNKLNLMVTLDAPEPYEVLPFDLSCRLHYLYRAAVDRLGERARVVQYLSEFPA